MVSRKNLFVTVGTTRFDSLIEAVSQAAFQTALADKGFATVTVQCGKSPFSPERFGTGRLAAIWYDYKPSISTDLLASDLVICHAGAGTCLEVLYARKPAIVVVNEELMDNHQVELAEKLRADGCVACCTCPTLLETLQSFDPSALKPFPRGDPKAFADFIDGLWLLPDRG